MTLLISHLCRSFSHSSGYNRVIISVFRDRAPFNISLLIAKLTYAKCPTRHVVPTANAEQHEWFRPCSVRCSGSDGHRRRLFSGGPSSAESFLFRAACLFGFSENPLQGWSSPLPLILNQISWDFSLCLIEIEE